ncbi:hypothetical protein [Streptomyces griseorubiginosus]|uniref:hypothetical protein n=1 Tax=Streptomyces griseorubiginosus TaxID=67304 RepID=UPI002E802A82|nr:hypothetical protein [Streptomyces griseorubiginosus]WUB44571.1 hypothetical protein OHN19_14980 [Streptomyces griseorubiginosus]WUB53088.1 hypothetical protein OG942_14975 [Streptomyces griseorubiginosus]
MALNTYFYGSVFAKAFSGQINVPTDTIKIALVGPGYTPNRNTQGAWSTVSPNEVSGTGYTAGGQALANKALSYASYKMKMDADDVTWTGLTANVRWAVVYDDTATGKPLIGYVDLGETLSLSNEDFTIQFSFFESDPDSGAITSGSGLFEIEVS